ncbi:MAG: long-chain acyl-CoA synthetase [Halioglobus sp.]|jgi:long-chain acyl-CoA synthetase
MSNSAAPGPGFKTPLEMFYQWEAQMPDQTWLRHFSGGAWVGITWAAAGALARRLAAGIQAMGLEKGDKLGIFATNSPEWIISDIASMMAGMVTVPIYTTMPMDKVKYVAEHSDMRAVIVGSGICLEVLRSELPSGVLIVGLPGVDSSATDQHWDSLISQNAPLDGNPLRDPQDLWTIVYTSGTTGMPKGVMHSFATLPYSASAIPIYTGANEQGRLFSYLPLAHVAERVLVELQSIYSGASIGFNGSKDSFTDDLREVRPTFFLAVPRIWTNLKTGIVAQMGNEAWQKLLENPERSAEIGKSVLASMGLEAVSFAFSGAAPIAADDIRAWRALGMPLYEGFGQSEMMSGTLNVPGKDKIGSVGCCFTQFGGELSISNIGEILLRAPGAMVGYYKEPEKTKEAFLDGWVRTGDKGRIDEDGFLFITGRVKEIFKTAKGKYVAPGPIEKLFEVSPHVDQLCLVGSGRPQTLMLVNMTAASATIAKELVTRELEQQRQRVNDNLEAHERISHVIICAEPWTMENRLLTHTLKILRDDVEKNHQPSIESCMQGASGTTVVWE